MSRYQNVDCPICNKSLGNGETVVVCPQCGAPYHIDCYKMTGECIFADLHDRNESWKSPYSEPSVVENPPKNCANCGSSNPADGLFCRTCGADLVSQESIPFPQKPDGSPMAGMPFPPFASPFEPITATEEIDGVKACELSAFVGKNAQYYIHRFKQLSKSFGKYKIINWAGFMFMGWHFIYRKMYGIGIATVITQFVLNIPYYIMLMTEMTSATPFTSNDASLASLTTANMVANMVLILFRFLCGYFANTLYKKHTYKKIAKIKAKTTESSEHDYMIMLSKKGGVAIKLIFGISLTYMAINILSLAFIMFM